jgi:hypothetical protein
MSHPDPASVDAPPDDGHRMPQHPAIALLPALRAAVAALHPDWAEAELDPLPDTGLAHHHVRLRGTAALARIPKQSQMGLGAQQNLDHQAACFERTAASGHAPRLLGVLAPQPGLERGALLVEFIDGRAASLPRDLPAIVVALARIHSLALPDRSRRPPLGDADDPLAALAEEIAVQARYLDGADLAAGTRMIVDRELARLATAVNRDDRPGKRLITFDAHPGNFVIRDNGDAVIVDLEKCRYSYPALDLAHATLYTSTTWQPGDAVALASGEVAGAVDLWAVESARGQRAGRSEGTVADGVSGVPPTVGAAGAIDAPEREWFGVLRRAMWLWSITWCAKWRVLSGSAVSGSSDGEDWAVGNSDGALAAHVRDRVDHYLDDEVAARVVAEFDQLEV